MPMTEERVGIHSSFPTAGHFWRLVVIPDYIVCRHQETARTIFHAATSIWHLQEWIFAENPLGHATLADFTRELERRCPNLGLLRDVADAGKHRYLGRASVQAQSTEPTVPGLARRGVMSTTIIATIRRKDGTKAFVSDTLMSCTEFLQREFFPDEPAAETEYQACARSFHEMYSPTFLERLITLIDPLFGLNRVVQRCAYYDILQFCTPRNTRFRTDFTHLIAAIRNARHSAKPRYPFPH